MMKCEYCNRPAVYFKHISGIAYCKSCFLKYLKEKVRWTINTKKLLERTDHILLAVSGGKDSIAMMKIVSEIEKEYSNVNLTAITIDEGIKGYREEGIKIAKKYSKMLGITHIVSSFKDFYGYTLTEIMEKVKKVGLPFHACTYCGVLRRKILNVKGRDIGVTKIATAHNLDDEAQTILMNILRGDVERLIRTTKIEHSKEKGFIPRVKPMQYIPEKEIALYVYYNGMDIYSQECPFSSSSLRNELRTFLNSYEEEHGDVKFSIISSFEKILSLLKDDYNMIKINACKYCGEPTTRDICRACELLEALKVF